MKYVILSAAFIFSLFVHAQKFDDFLVSLQEKLPLRTDRMRTIITSYHTRLAHPSWLEQKGLINSEAAASYNGILNSLILKPNMTTSLDGSKNGPQRLKSWQELRKDQPAIWNITMGIIFHELSHAEFSWMQNSTDVEDRALVDLLNGEFREYLREKVPTYTILDRYIAPSELFAYFREEALQIIITSIDDIFISNGYNKFKKNCFIPAAMTQFFDQNREANPLHFRWQGQDQNFENRPLPTIYVLSKEMTIDPKSSFEKKIKTALWSQYKKHFQTATSISQIIKWMNSSPRLLRLIKPCREQLIQARIERDEKREAEINRQILQMYEDGLNSR